MVDLAAKSPAAGLLPVSHGDLVLQESDIQEIWSIAPFSGAERAVSAALRKSLKMSLPPIGRATRTGSAKLLWAGRDVYFLVGSGLPAKLNAAVTDQSDAWCCVTLEGAHVEAVLARICPLDLRNMETGSVARSLLGHMTAIIVKIDNGYELMVFRAFAKTLVHELQDAMRSVDAQTHLSD